MALSLLCFALFCGLTAGQTDNWTDPDRYKHCDYIDLVEVGYREDSLCEPGDQIVFKVSNSKYMSRLKHTH